MSKREQASYAIAGRLWWREIGLSLALYLLGASVVVAQLTTGTIAGTVTDQTGAATPGSTVTVKNVETGILRALVAGPNGRYEALNLAVGHYEVSAALSGFRTTVRSGIELTVGRTALVDLVLQVGEVTQAVTVTGEAPLVETSTATVSNLVDEKRVEDLPLNNRDLTQLTYLQPGVLRVPQSSGQNVNGGLGDKLSVAGSRSSQNLYLLDGVSNSDFSGNPQGASGSYTGAETVKEFQIIINNYSAEYKSAAGAIVSAVTKSGTNSFHGSLFEFLRNDKVDAAKWEDNAFGNAKPPFRRNQFGGSLGGPIRKDKTFFFGSYEGLREALGTTGSARVPTSAARQGILPLSASACATGGGTVPSTGLCQLTINGAIKPYLLDLYPIPGQENTMGQDFGDGTVQIAGTRSQPTTDNFMTARIDHQFSGGKAGFLSGTYNYDKSERSPVGLLPFSGTGSRSLRHVVSVRHTSVLSSTAINEFAFGYSLNTPEAGYPLTNHDFSNLLFVPGRQFVGSISVTGGQIAGVGFSTGDTIFAQKDLSFKEGLSLTRGKHSFRIGAEIHRVRDDFTSITMGYYGGFTFASLTNFLTNVPLQFQGTPPGGDDIIRNLKQLLPGFYFQDNYALLPSLTLNLGLRYEFVTLPHEVNGKVSSFLHTLDTAVTVGGNYYTNATLKSFSPRFGFAWAPGAKKSSVRGGFGIFYDFPTLYTIQTTIGSMPPYTVIGTIKDTDAAAAGTTLRFPDAYTFDKQLLSGTPEIRAAEYNQRNAYIYRWSLTLQQQLGGGWVFSAGYTGSRALHLWTQAAWNINRWEGWPNQPTGPKFFPTPVVGRINPNWSSSARIQYPNGNSYYQGLTLSAQKRLSRGLQFQASYTFSKSIDQGSSPTQNGDNLTEGQRGLYAWDMNLKRGLSSFDIRNSLSSNFSYEIPVGQNLTGLRGELIKGWQLNGILSVSSGYPLSIQDPSTAQNTRIGSTEDLHASLIPGGNQNPVLGGPDKYYDTSQFTPSTVGYFGTLGRNTLITPGLINFDFSLFKDIAVAEKSRFQFRAELFNLFNRSNFGSPNVTAFASNGTPNPAAGHILSTRTSSRQIQFSLKYIF